MRIDGINKSGIKELGIGEDGRAWVEANSIIKAAHVSGEFSDLWSWVATGNYDAGDTWLLVQNNDPNKVLRVQNLTIYSDTATAYQIFCPVPATFTGAGAVDPICLNNPTTERLPLDIAFQDETANAQANVIRNSYLAANTVIDLDFSGMLVLNYLESVAVDLTADAADGRVGIVGWFENKNGTKINL